MTPAPDDTPPYIADSVDRDILRQLQADARQPFSSIAAAVGVSDQTVARRYQRMRRLAGVRVTALPNPDQRGRQVWLLRIRVRPSERELVIAHLERRDDTAWINYISGPHGPEVALMAYRRRGPGTSVLDQAAALRGVESFIAQQCVHMYFGGQKSLLDNGASAPTVSDAQGRPSSKRPTTPSNDRRLLAVLELDGRASIAQLSKASGLDEDTVAKRVSALAATGSHFFDVDFDPELLGLTASFAVWATVHPAELTEAALALAGHAEVSFVAATTGDTNLYAMAHSVDTAAMAAYITGPLALIPGLKHLTTAPVLRAIKRALRTPSL